MNTAKYLDSGKAQCLLCAHACLLDPGETGRCGVRRHNGQTLESLVRDGVAAWHVDPVEKKPLYHYLPGTLTFSFGTAGCNFDCAWCQNDSISREAAETGRIRSTPATPEALVHAAGEQQCRSVAFTYTEPTVFFELMAETADRALTAGLGTIMVSNGFQSPACLDALKNRIQAANIDLKSFRDETYRRYCKGRLQPVLDNLKRMKALGWWLETTTLIVPGVNDDPAELRDIARFVSQELGRDTPWHISAFHPCRHMLSTPPTPQEILRDAADIGRDEGLSFVYVGNTATDQSTRCATCGETLIERRGFQIRKAPDFKGVCPRCAAMTPGIWSLP